MKKYKVTIRGLSPYMQHRMDDVKLEEWEKNRGKIMERPEVSQADAMRAEYHCYRNPSSGECYMPSDHLKQALIAASTNFKSKTGNSRKSMKDIVAGMFRVTPMQITLPNYDQIDKRSAVNRAAKVRVIVIRPKWSEGWEATFTLEVEEDSVTEDMVKDMIAFTGNYVGVGSYRPTNKGEFGRFEVATIKAVK